MISSNAAFRLERIGDTMNIHTGDARGPVLSLYPEGEKLVYASPKYQTHKYQQDPVTTQWRSETDKHFLVELLTRDLIYYAKGVPTF